MFKSAYSVGKSFAAYYLEEHPQAEVGDAILAGMAYAAKEYTSQKARRNFYDGCSDWANMIGRIRTRKMVYGNDYHRIFGET
jgi:hypothetical protein